METNKNLFKKPQLKLDSLQIQRQKAQKLKIY